MFNINNRVLVVKFKNIRTISVFIRRTQLFENTPWCAFVRRIFPKRVVRIGNSPKRDPIVRKSPKRNILNVPALGEYVCAFFGADSVRSQHWKTDDYTEINDGLRSDNTDYPIAVVVRWNARPRHHNMIYYNHILYYNYYIDKYDVERSAALKIKTGGRREEEINLVCAAFDDDLILMHVCIIRENKKNRNKNDVTAAATSKRLGNTTDVGRSAARWRRRFKTRRSGVIGWDGGREKKKQADAAPLISDSNNNNNILLLS